MTNSELMLCAVADDEPHSPKPVRFPSRMRSRMSAGSTARPVAMIAALLLTAPCSNSTMAPHMSEIHPRSNKATRGFGRLRYRSLAVGLLRCWVSGHIILCYLLIFDLNPVAVTELLGPFRGRLKGIEERGSIHSRLPGSTLLHKSSYAPCQKRFTISGRESECGRRRRIRQTRNIGAAHRILRFEVPS